MDIIQIYPNANYTCNHSTRTTGFTSLMYLANNTRDHPEYLEQIENILENKLEDINKQNDSGWTALMLSSRNSNTTSTLDTVSVLLKYQPNVNIQDNYGFTSLMHAICSMHDDSNQETCKLLLDHGANINTIDKSGYNIIFVIILWFYSFSENAKYRQIKYILDNTNIDLNYTIDGLTAYDTAIKEGYNSIAELIKKYQDNSLDTKCALD